MEEEEEDVELSDFPSNGIDLRFFVRDAAEDELFFFEPLLQEKLVCWRVCDLVERVSRLCLHDRWIRALI